MDDGFHFLFTQKQQQQQQQQHQQATTSTAIMSSKEETGAQKRDASDVYDRQIRLWGKEAQVSECVESSRVELVFRECRASVLIVGCLGGMFEHAFLFVTLAACLIILSNAVLVYFFVTRHRQKWPRPRYVTSLRF